MPNVSSERELANPERLADVRRRAMARLADVSETPALDADLIIAEALGVARATLYVEPEREIPPSIGCDIERMMNRRASGEPVAYILNRRAFRAIDLYVDQRVLIPRPETEHLVEVALEWLRSHPGPRRVVDVGTGSGAIALALASELPANRADVEILGVDVSCDALEVARKNRERLDLTRRVALLQSDLLHGVEGSFDVILANLPYLRAEQRDPSTAAEPELALHAGRDGLDLYRRLIEQLPGRLRQDGLLVLEIDPSQASDVRTLVSNAIGGEVRVERDLAGFDRYVIREMA